MGDFSKKLAVYFSRRSDYWELQKKSSNRYPISFYPLVFGPRIDQGHYEFFDEDGFPLFHSKEGNLVRFITGLCSYVFAVWEKHLEGNEDVDETIIIRIADYLIESTEECNGVKMIKDYPDDSRQGLGLSCAMNQGEAISVLVRAFSISRQSKYLEHALDLLKAFEKPYGTDGVSEILSDKSLWYLEGGRKILNGHNYALIGIYELTKVTDSPLASELFQKGLNGLKERVEKFDLGFWSKYWLNKPTYVASAMYHNLHICQLEYLESFFHDKTIEREIRKFKKYQASFFGRMLAAMGIFVSKIRLRAAGGTH